MRNLVWLLLAAILLFATCQAQAQHCYVAPAQAYVAPSYSYQQAVAAVTYYPSYYPVYSVSYRGADEGSLREELLKLKIELQQLQIQQLKANGPEALPLKVSMLSQKCASCHDEKRAKDSGAGLVMFKGGQLTLNADQRLNAIKLVSTGMMPKGGKLTEDEAGAVIGELLE